MVFDGFTFKRQYKGSETVYGNLARHGHRITWVTGNGRKIRIVDNTVYFEETTYKRIP